MQPLAAVSPGAMRIERIAQVACCLFIRELLRRDTRRLARIFNRWLDGLQRPGLTIVIGDLGHWLDRRANRTQCFGDETMDPSPGRNRHRVVQRLTNKRMAEDVTP